MPERVERNLADDVDRRGVQELGYLGTCEGCTDDDEAIFVDDNPRRPKRVAAVEAAARVTYVGWATARTSSPAASADSSVWPSAATCGR